MKKLLLVICFWSLWAVPAYADFVAATGTFTLSSGTGTQQITDAACAQPKVVLLFWTRATADVTYTADNTYGFGVAVDETVDQVMNTSLWDDDNVGTTDSVTAKRTADLAYNVANGAGGANSIFTISSFNSNGFTINRTTNDGTNLNIYHYVCLGGSDITNAFVGEFGATTGTGSQSFTGVGFQGNLGIFFGGWQSASGNNTSARFIHSWGVANSSQQNVMGMWGQDATTSANAAESYINSSNILAIGDLGTGGVHLLASLTSFDSDGFTINKGTDPGSTRYFFALILKGTFQSHIGQQARATSTGNQAVTGVGFSPDLLMIGGAFPTANATETIQAHLVMGAGTSSSDDNGIWTSNDSAISTDANHYSDSGNIYTQATNPSTTAAQAGLSTMDSGGYTLNWGTADANARLFFHLALAAAASNRRPIAPMVMP